MSSFASFCALLCPFAGFLRPFCVQICPTILPQEQTRQSAERFLPEISKETFISAREDCGNAKSINMSLCLPDLESGPQAKLTLYSGRTKVQVQLYIANMMPNDLYI